MQDRSLVNKMVKHFTATTYVFDEKLTKTLLHWHVKLQSWLPPGGHLEPNETPYESALRELYEEYGISDLSITYAESKINGTDIASDDRISILKMPFFIISEKIEEDHYHLDCLYYTLLDETTLKSVNTDNILKWFSLDTIMNSNESIFYNVKKFSLMLKEIAEKQY